MIQYVSFVCETIPNDFTDENETVTGYISEDEYGYPCNWSESLDGIIDEISRDGDFAVICHL